MKKLNYLLPVIVFTCILFGLCVKGITSADKTYSSAEKRELQTRPKMSAEAIRKGTFQEKYETYLSDQFPGRDMWVQLQTDASRLMGKSVSNGVYFGKDDYLLEHHTDAEFETKQERKNIKSLVELVKNIADDYSVHVMLVPTKTWTLQQKLPFCASTYDEQKMYDSLNEQLGNLADSVVVPVQETLCSHREEDIYYRTDHHWTTLGAWYGYQSFLKASGMDEKRADEKKDFITVSDDFLGTTYAKVNQASAKDVIEAYEPKMDLDVVYNMGETKLTTLFAPSYLKTSDEYSYFTGGNQAIIEITGGEKNGKTLLVIKDSFANCMIPFLAEDYEKVIVVDLRQLNIGCQAILDTFCPTDVLILYNTAQFAQYREFALNCYFSSTTWKIKNLR